MTPTELLRQRLAEAGAALALAHGPAQLAQAITNQSVAPLVLEDHPWLQAAAAHFPAEYPGKILFMEDFLINPLSPPEEGVRAKGASETAARMACLSGSCPPLPGATLVSIGLGAVPETGSVLLGCGSPQTFRLSLCPRRHIVVIPAHQAGLTMAQALALTAREPSGLVTWITGPSRTADIEKVLVLGAQGASELLVVVYQES